MPKKKIPAKRCAICGRALVNTAAGNYSTCPQMHGKLQQKLDKDQAKLNAIQELHDAGVILPWKKVKRDGKVWLPKSKLTKQAWKVDGVRCLKLSQTSNPLPHVDEAGRYIVHKSSSNSPYWIFQRLDK